MRPACLFRGSSQPTRCVSALIGLFARSGYRDDIDGVVMRFISKWWFTVLTATVLTSAPAYSAAIETKVSVAFKESAPKDSFTITNAGTCTTFGLHLKIDLEPSRSGLIFDPTGSGAGVEVFQPLKITTGQDIVENISTVRDGSQSVMLKIKPLKPGARIAFTIDVDDTLTRSELGQTRVSGGEIAGAEILGRSADGSMMRATFGSDSTALISRIPCA